MICYNYRWMFLWNMSHIEAVRMCFQFLVFYHKYNVTYAIAELVTMQKARFKSYTRIALLFHWCAWLCVIISNNTLPYSAIKHFFCTFCVFFPDCAHPLSKTPVATQVLLYSHITPSSPLPSEKFISRMCHRHLCS